MGWQRGIKRYVWNFLFVELSLTGWMDVVRGGDPASDEPSEEVPATHGIPHHHPSSATGSKHMSLFALFDLMESGVSSGVRPDEALYYCGTSPRRGYYRD